MVHRKGGRRPFCCEQHGGAPRGTLLARCRSSWPLRAEAQGLAGERRSDVGRHVISSFVVMEITAVFWNGIGHPCIQVLQHPWIGVLVDGEAGAGVQAGEMQNALVQTRAADPGVQLPVQSGDPFRVATVI